MVKLNENELKEISGGKVREKYVSAFYCEYCRKTIHLNTIYSLDRARKEHNTKYHPNIPIA